MTRDEFIGIYRSIVPEHAYREVNGVGIFTIPAFSAYPGIDHGFSARTGGVSEGCFSSLNLSFTRPELHPPRAARKCNGKLPHLLQRGEHSR